MASMLLFTLDGGNMFSLILTMCFTSGSIEICEHQTMKERLSVLDCMDRMELVIQDIRVSPFHAFEWAVSCEVEKE